MRRDGECGVIYCATGSYYRRQAHVSVHFLRQFSPDLEITIFVDDASDIKTSLFDNVVSLPCERQLTRFDKLYALRNSPYSRTLFLDTDAVPVRDISVLFSGLEYFDLMLCHAPVRINEESRFVDDPFVNYFPELNSGVIFYANSQHVHEALLNPWEDMYRSYYPGTVRDQESLHKVIHDSNLKHHILPPECNFRLEFSHQSKGRNYPVFIIHSHTAVERGCQYIENNLIPRLADLRFYTWYKPDRALTKIKKVIKNVFNNRSGKKGVTDSSYVRRKGESGEESG